MNTLIERIDEFLHLMQMPVGHYVSKTEQLITDCKAEIQRLTTNVMLLENIREVAHSQIAALKRDLSKAKEYVPMTEAELVSIVENAEKEAFRMGSYIPETGFEPYRAVEAEVIKRAGLVVKEKE